MPARYSGRDSARVLDREITVLSRSKKAASIGTTIVRGPHDVERSSSDQSKSISSPSRARSTVPSDQSSRTRSQSDSSSSSEWFGSWWNRSSRFAPASRANSATCWVLEWPNPARGGYSSSVYWQSWIRTSAPAATSNPETHPGSAVARSTPSAGSWSVRYARLRAPSSIRYPTVGPRWTIGRAVTVADPIVHGSPGASWSATVAGTSPSRTGNSGGERYREIRSVSDRVGEG